MHDRQSPESEARTATPPRPPGELDDSWVQPSSSRMLTNYLADVEQNLDEHRWELALRDVADLPKIAVALTDPELRSSHERCKAWCEQWIRPSNAASDSDVDPESICRVLGEKAGNAGTTPTVPSAELRRLRLRRHARNTPRGFNASPAGADDQDSATAFAICTAVVEAVRRWYAHFACHDATAQANLARLAVLR
ncbi:MAG: hypothetical protein ACJ8R9_28425 [Steroidobacteraceae bacterium]